MTDNGGGIFRAQQFVSPQYALVEPHSDSNAAPFNAVPRWPEAPRTRTIAAGQAPCSARQRC
jgi:hypothetical protein